MIDEVIKKLEENRERRLRGDLIAIPWEFERLSNYLPGVRQGHYTIISSQTKGGKSQITNYLYMFQPINWYIKNKDKTNISLKIFYFSLELSRDVLIMYALSHKLFESYGIIISPDNLQSAFNKYILNKDILDILNSPEFKAWQAEFESIVEIIDDVRNPTGIMKLVQAYAESNGKYEYTEKDWYNDDGAITKKRVIDKYIPNKPDEYVIVICDHAALISKEREHTNLHEAIGDLSSRHFLKMRDRFNYSPVLIQQQSAASTDAQYTMRGDIVVDKIKPTPEGLGENKTTSRDCNLMLSLFWPYMYQIPEYSGWNLHRIGNNHRELVVNLNRNGASNIGIDLYFNGACGYFKELPKEPSEKVYQQIELWNSKTI